MRSRKQSKADGGDRQKSANCSRSNRRGHLLFSEGSPSLCQIVYIGKYLGGANTDIEFGAQDSASISVIRNYRDSLAHHLSGELNSNCRILVMDEPFCFCACFLRLRTAKGCIGCPLIIHLLCRKALVNIRVYFF